MNDVASSFVALRYRNFRLLWLGQLVSMVGSMMQNVAILWHISLLVPPAQKGLALGLVGLVRVVPIIILSLVSGVVADVLDRRKVMLLTQTGMALTAIVLAIVSFAGLHVAWPIYVLTALSAGIGTFDGPARQALIPSLVPAEHFPNAISLNTVMFQFAAVLGPALGGLVLATRGVSWVYAFNAISFVAVIVGLLLMRDLPVRARAAEQAQPHISLGAAIDGLRFVFGTPLIRSTMLLDFFATFFSSATALLPIFAQDILQVGAQGYGLLFAAPAVGAFVAGLGMLRVANRIQRRGWVLLSAVLVYGLATVVFGVSHLFWLTFACLALTGAADTVSMVLRNVVRQLATPDELRGRMTSVNMIFFMGGPQLGELEAGVVANAWGAPLSVISG
ncbi:MAG: MFS transporter, partial [Herpetosiphonaceae bacterium]|nr:MFS transporter [Herpetosiphonaceae bacterium]